MGVGEVGVEGVKMAQKSSYMGFFNNIRLQEGSLQQKTLSSCQSQNKDDNDDGKMSRITDLFCFFH